MQRYRKILKYAKKCVTLHRFLILIDMKKGFVLAFLVMSLAVSAQTVNPLTIELGDFNLDSLRTLYSAEPTMYRASLEVLEQSVQKQLDAVALVKKEIKAEQNHAKEVANSLKVASKMTAAMKKLYSQEEAELKAMQKTVDKQQKTFAKQKDLNQDTRDSYNLFLENEQKELSYSLREVADRQRAITDLETYVQTTQGQLQNFQQEITQKTASLVQIETELKTRMTTVKAEKKAAKGLQ